MSDASRPNFIRIVFGLVTNVWFIDGINAVAKYTQFACRIATKIIKQDMIAKIAMLSHDKIEECHAMMERCHLVLPDLWGMMDRLIKFMKNLMT